MNIHENARTTPASRALLVRRVMQEGWSARKAAIAQRFHGQDIESRIETLLGNIVPALDGIDPSQPEDRLMPAAVEANVRHTLVELRATPEVRARVAEGTSMRLVGAVYELSTGRVRFLD